MSITGSARNVSCPCGSGKKFKYCHGRAKTQRLTISLLVGGVLLIAVLAIMATSGLGSRDGEQPESSTPRTTLYTSIPGLQLQLLSSAEQGQLLTDLNNTPCSCDCDMTVAECRHLDPDCQHSKDLAQASFSQLVSQNNPLPLAPIKSTH